MLSRFTTSRLNSRRMTIRAHAVPLFNLGLLFHLATQHPSTIAVANASSSSSQLAGNKYALLKKTRLSHDSCLLRFTLPAGEILGDDPMIPTCIKVTLPPDVDGDENKPKKAIAKSYSPISHPSIRGYFDLVVKAYPFQPGGGVGAYLCGLDVNPHDDANADVDSKTPEDPNAECQQLAANTFIQSELKSPRIMHGSSSVLHRWKHIGLVAGGTGIAPLFQIARIVLEANADDIEGGAQTVHLLFVNQREEDILMKGAIDALVEEFPGRFFVTYSLTRAEGEVEGENEEDSSCIAIQRGRGSAKMALDALPSPANGDGSTMVFVCGKDGFVESWGGPVGRAPDSPDGKRGKKIQGPLLGWLAEAGFQASEVFKY